MTRRCEDECPTRRSALKLSAAAGGVALLGGCAVYGGAADTPVAADQGDPSADAGDPSADPGPDDEPAVGTDEKADKKPGLTLTSTEAIPVGGGKIFARRGVVVTQPTAGIFKAFSTECTHQGCAVGTVADGTIGCLCHGSKFKITDGSVTEGPARRPLASRKIAVDGDSVTLV